MRIRITLPILQGLAMLAETAQAMCLDGTERTPAEQLRLDLAAEWLRRIKCGQLKPSA